MSEYQGSDHEERRLIIDELSRDLDVIFLAGEILDGEITVSGAAVFPTDMIEYRETCTEIAKGYKVDQSLVEQAIEEAKARLIEERSDNAE